MKGLARTLIALLVAGALFVAMAVPALAAHDAQGGTSAVSVNNVSPTAEAADPGSFAELGGPGSTDADGTH